MSPLAVTMGDPAGCGPQITTAAWKALAGSEHSFYVISDENLYKNVPVEVISDPTEAVHAFSKALPILRLADTELEVETGVPDPSTAHSTIASISEAVSHVLSNKASAIVTNPISKAVLYSAGFKHAGHTEFIAELCKRHTGQPNLKPVMMLVGGGLRVALATIHVPVRDVPDLLTKDMLVKLGLLVSNDLQTRFGLTRPRLVFTGLNPHAGEAGSIGSEEIDVINPAAEDLRKNGIDMADARPADTVFYEALQGDYDCVIAMTHDQGLIPVKTLDIWGGVNTTLGLPIIRTSPDHGTAYDAARIGNARPDSLIAAIKLASQMSRSQLA